MPNKWYVSKKNILLALRDAGQAWLEISHTNAQYNHQRFAIR